MRLIANGVSIRPVSASPTSYGYASAGDPDIAESAVDIDPDHDNSIIDELKNVLAAAGLTPNPADDTQLLQAIRVFTRIRLRANLNLYVSGSGSDSNPGTSGAPFKTLQGAWNALATGYDLNGFTVVVNVADGTYTAGLVALGAVVGNQGSFAITFQGNAGSPGNVVIAPTAASPFAASFEASFSISGMTLSASGAGAAGSALAASFGGKIQYSNIVFGACAGSHVYADRGGIIQYGGNYAISGNAQSHFLASNGGVISSGSTSPVTISLSGTPAFSVAFANANFNGVLLAGSTSFSGSATGQRYSASQGANIVTNGGGANYFPGSAAGTATTGYYT